MPVIPKVSTCQWISTNSSFPSSLRTYLAPMTRRTFWAKVLAFSKGKGCTNCNKSLPPYISYQKPRSQKKNRIFEDSSIVAEFLTLSGSSGYDFLSEPNHTTRSFSQVAVNLLTFDRPHWWHTSASGILRHRTQPMGKTSGSSIFKFHSCRED